MQLPDAASNRKEAGYAEQMEPTTMQMLKDFWSTLKEHWIASVSGGFGFIVTGLFACLRPTETAIRVWIGTSLLAVIWVAWPIWAAEHRKVLALKEQLRPKFRVLFNQEQRGMVLAKQGHSSGPDVYYFRICVLTANEATVKECQAYITALEKQTKSGEAFIHIDLPQPICLTMVPRQIWCGVPEQIDFMIANSVDNTLRPAPEVRWPLVLADAFSEQAVYRFTFRVNGDGITAPAICVEIDWKGQWDRVGARQVDPPR